ncbi:MAG: UDP-N-acetylmuramoyl-L-alanine--D-glutamate ligase [Proteobacteria bacterium]|jgi:UDP-N-acetylmuramoyl-L-alanine---L-glutamate ligase|nr:UDP-N-acetylmuramoyl-L-alanine--D-glutamate ligase [Pseudomonadota bacterium]
MNLSDLADKNVALWGLGLEGLTTLDFLQKQFPHKKFILINDKVPDDFDNHGNRFIFEADLINNLDNIDVVIKSPGISYYHDYVKIMIDRGIKITSATNIWFGLPKAGKVISITGSNGKSTSSSMLHHILITLGKNALLGGNIGTPLLSLANGADYYVVELSSYQTCDLHYPAEIALLLNLFPEHIQWHKSHEVYYRDKCNLLKRGNTVNIVNYHESRTKDIVKDLIYFNDPSALHFKDRIIWDGKKQIGPTKGFPLLGDHNLENLCAVLSICKVLSLNLKDCLNASFTYQGLPHRIEMLGKIGNHYFVNDSISTDPEATIAALKALKDKSITLLAGGQNREQDYRELCTLIDKLNINAVITMYETGPKIADQIQSTQTYRVKTLQEAVILAKKITPVDGYIVLSPASPSYDAFKNFEHRGALFAEYSRLPLIN